MVTEYKYFCVEVNKWNEIEDKRLSYIYSLSLKTLEKVFVSVTTIWYNSIFYSKNICKLGKSIILWIL